MTGSSRGRFNAGANHSRIGFNGQTSKVPPGRAQDNSVDRSSVPRLLRNQEFFSEFFPKQRLSTYTPTHAFAGALSIDPSPPRFAQTDFGGMHG